MGGSDLLNAVALKGQMSLGGCPFGVGRSGKCRLMDGMISDFAGVVRV